MIAKLARFLSHSECVQGKFYYFLTSEADTCYSDNVLLYKMNIASLLTLLNLEQKLLRIKIVAKLQKKDNILEINCGI